MSRIDTFEVQPLSHVQHVLSSHERDTLLKHGALATRLDRGVQLPSTERQVRFVAVCTGQAPPETDFESLWVRYKQTIQLDQRISALIEEASQHKHNADTLRKSLFDEIQKAKSEAEQQDAVMKQLQQKILAYERKLGINQPTPGDPSDKYSVSGDQWREQP